MKYFHVHSQQWNYFALLKFSFSTIFPPTESFPFKNENSLRSLFFCLLFVRVNVSITNLKWKIRNHRVPAYFQQIFPWQLSRKTICEKFHSLQKSIFMSAKNILSLILKLWLVNDKIAVKSYVIGSKKKHVGRRENK